MKARSRSSSIPKKPFRQSNTRAQLRRKGPRVGKIRNDNAETQSALRNRREEGMTKRTMHGEVKIRRAKSADAPRIAVLAGQLGYPATAAEMRKRLLGIKPASLHAVFVADAPKDGVIGWVHVSKQPLLEDEIRAEVNGLVVAEGQRSLGAGARLLAAAEDWARKHGCKSMSVRSNVIRERAHKFYERNGYEHYKTQKSFRKPL